MRPACLSRYGQPHVASCRTAAESAVTIRAIEDAWREAFRRGNHFFVLAAIVGGSTILHWLAARRFGGLWILPDEGIYAARATDLWQHGLLPLRHGQGGYGLLYPLLIGAPLSVGTVAQGYGALKLLQAFAVSLAAVPVFILGRRLMADRYALVASLLTVAVPVLLYSGLVMTEVLFYPIAACALLAIAYSVSSGTARSQLGAFAAILLAAATRPQAVVFVPVLAAAVLLDAFCARDGSRLRSFWPTWLLVGVSVIALAAFPSLVGAYAGTLRGGYPFGAGVRLSAEHLSFAALACGVIPFAAVVVLSVQAIRGLERDPRALSVHLGLHRGLPGASVAGGILRSAVRAAPPGSQPGAVAAASLSRIRAWLSRGATRGRVAGPLVAFGGGSSRVAGAVELVGRTGCVRRHVRRAARRARARCRARRRGDGLRPRHAGGLRVRPAPVRDGACAAGRRRADRGLSRRGERGSARRRRRPGRARAGSGLDRQHRVRGRRVPRTRAARRGTSSGSSASGIAVCAGSTRSPPIACPARSRRPR